MFKKIFERTPEAASPKRRDNLDAERLLCGFRLTHADGRGRKVFIRHQFQDKLFRDDRTVR